MRFVALLLALLVACLLGSATAQAQDVDEVPIPAAAPVVAGPTATGATLVAFDRGRQVCLAIRVPDEGTGEAQCAAVPRLPEETVTVTDFAQSGEEQAHRGGLVAADVATVEERFAKASAGRPTSVATATVAGEAYTGRAAGRGRFWLAETPDGLPWLTRLVGADGRALFADLSPFERPIVGRPVDVARGRSGGRSVRLRASVRPALAATPLERDRIENEVCLGVVLGDSPESVCRGRRPPATDLEVTRQTGCGSNALVLVASSRVRRAVAVLGDGRRRPVQLVGAPAVLRLPQTRLGAFVVRGEVAVRRVEGFGADGRRLATADVGLAPAQPCTDGTFSVFFFDADVDDRGPLRLSARDDADRLCVALGDLDPRGRDCALPPTTVRESSLDVRATTAGKLVAGAVDARIAAVEVRSSAGTRRVETTDDVPDYGGQYRGLVRFVSVPLPSTAAVRDVRFLDTAGRQLGRQTLFEDPRPTGRGTPLGGRGIRARAFRTTSSGACLTVDVDEDGCYEPTVDVVSIAASCAPRAVVLFGAVRASTTLVEVLLAGRPPLRARLARIGDRTFFVGVVPPSARVIGFRATGRTMRTATMRTPPARRQCGYVDIDLLRPPGET